MSQQRRLGLIFIVKVAITLAIGVALVGGCAGILFWWIPAIFRKWAAAGFPDTQLERVSVTLFWFAIPLLSLTLYGLAKWSVLLVGFAMLLLGGPPLPSGVSLIQNKSAVRIRLPNSASGSAFLWLFIVSFPALPAALLLRDLNAPAWLALATPGAAMLALVIWRLRQAQKQLDNGRFDLIVNQKNQTLDIPGFNFKRAPITIRLADPYEVFVDITELSDDGGTVTFYSVGLRHPSLPVVLIHQWGGEQDARQFAELLQEKTGLLLAP